MTSSGPDAQTRQVIIATATNLAAGQFDHRDANRTGQGQGLHGVIFCLDVDGEEARFQVPMENGDNGNIVVQEGGFAPPRSCTLTADGGQDPGGDPSYHPRLAACRPAW